MFFALISIRKISCFFLVLSYVKLNGTSEENAMMETLSTYDCIDMAVQQFQITAKGVDAKVPPLLKLLKKILGFNCASLDCCRQRVHHPKRRNSRNHGQDSA